MIKSERQSMERIGNFITIRRELQDQRSLPDRSCRLGSRQRSNPRRDSKIVTGGRYEAS